MSMRVTTALVALAVVLAGGAAARTIQKDYHEQFDVAEGSRLVLLHGDGDVDVTPWDKDVLDVTVVYRAEVTKIGLGRDPDFEVEFRQHGDEVRVIGRETSAVTIGFFNRTEYEYVYTIKAPAWLELVLEGDDGDVSVEGWRGPIDLDLDDGGVELHGLDVPRLTLSMEDGDFRARGVRGDLRLEMDDGEAILEDCEIGRGRIETNDGDIRIKDSEGSFDGETDDGSIEMVRVRLHGGELRTDDGDVDLQLEPADDLDLVVVTGGGDVSLDLGRKASAIFEIDTDDGRIRLDLPDAKVDQHEDDHASGTIGDGRGSIRIRSDDGRVRLSAS